MKYLLDTNVCIRYINGRSPQIRAKLPTLPRSEIAVSSITKAEMWYGSVKSQHPERSRQKQSEFFEIVQSVPFDDAAALYYSLIRARLELMGTPIGSHDMLIAAIAMSRDLILVTHNVGEFSRIDKLQIEDWEQG
ncbi:MAG TPA: type II toxin-antitoxin system VapC family toxin [Spirillospora sp.]|nr:type II toxin-antitoxin system VapC family toxin [Spirillospora sp.]